MSVMKYFRILLYYVLLALTTVSWCLASLLFAPLLGYRARYRLVAQSWCRCSVWMAKWILGIDYRLRGLENIPKTPCVILAKHQSTWETFFLTGYFAPLSHVLKREILRMPFFGWAIAKVKPIAIDRSNPKAALKQLATQGHERLMQGNWVLIFPEGTRVPVGKIGKFSRGGASLAVNANLPVLPVALDAGVYWPKDGWNKHPGTVQVVFGPLLYAEGSGPRAIAELNERAFAWIEKTQRELGVLDGENAVIDAEAKVS